MSGGRPAGGASASGGGGGSARGMLRSPLADARGDLVDLRSDTVTQPTPAMRRPWPRPWSVTTTTGRTRPCAPWRRPSPSGSASRPRSSCRRAPWPTRSPSASWPAGHRRRGRTASARGRLRVRRRRHEPGRPVHRVDDDDGMLEPADVAGPARPRRTTSPSVSLVSIENTHMAASGAPWSMDRPRAVVDAAGPCPSTWTAPVSSTPRRRPACRQPSGPRPPPRSCAACPRDCARPVGSLLAGPEASHRRGAAASASGSAAACARPACWPRPGWWPWRDMVERLPEDHARAAGWPRRWPGAGRTAGSTPATVRTNIVTFTHADPDKLLAHLRGEGVLAARHRPGDRAVGDPPRRGRRGIARRRGAGRRRPEEGRR